MRAATPALRRTSAAAGALALLALGTAGPALADEQVTPADRQPPGFCKPTDRDGVTVVVDFQALGGGIQVGCVEDPTSGMSGIEALKAAGFDTTPSSQYGDGIVCGIEGEPTSKPCRMPAADAYWSYWQAPNHGAWDYSNLGVANSTVKEGGFEGYSFLTSDARKAPRVAPARQIRRPATTQQPSQQPSQQPKPTGHPSGGQQSNGQGGQQQSGGQQGAGQGSSQGHHQGTHQGGGHPGGHDGGQQNDAHQQPGTTPHGTSSTPQQSSAPSSSAPSTSRPATSSAPSGQGHETQHPSPSHSATTTSKRPASRPHGSPRPSTSAQTSATTSTTSGPSRLSSGPQIQAVDQARSTSANTESDNGGMVGTLAGVGIVGLLAAGAGFAAWRRKHS